MIKARIITVGIILRLIWIAAVPPSQISDFANYMFLARNLLRSHAYLEPDGVRAFIAPGEPFFMATGLAIFGDRWWVPLILNLVCYVALSLLVFFLAHRLFGEQAARVSLIALAIWPSYIAFTGLAASENPFMVCYLLACMLPFGKGQKWVLLSGIAAGLGALIRPSVLLLPAIWFVCFLARRLSAKRLALATICMLATIAPWTLRNYAVLHALVPISTNGGDVFYRANNALATGGWTPRGEHLLPADELAANRLGYQLGEHWIIAHPLGFARLAVKKVYIFMRSDQEGVAWSERGRTGVHYAGTCWPCSLRWFSLIALTIYSLYRNRKSGDVWLLLLPFLYLLSIHAVFESADRHHLAAVPFLIVIASFEIAKRGGGWMKLMFGRRPAPSPKRWPSGRSACAAAYRQPRDGRDGAHARIPRRGDRRTHGGFVTVELKEVESSNIAKVGYDPATQTLHVKFKDSKFKAGVTWA